MPVHLLLPPLRPYLQLPQFPKADSAIRSPMPCNGAQGQTCKSREEQTEGKNKRGEEQTEGKNKHANEQKMGRTKIIRNTCRETA